MSKRQTDYDSPWKEVIEHFFPEFLLFFFPQIYAEIDWAQRHEFLDKELQKILPKAKTGRGYVDKLVKVWLKDGTDVWLLIHIEVQSQVEEGFTERMYIYNYRIFDLYKHPVISLALLADDDPDWRPETYGFARWGFHLDMHFLSVKLLDYAPVWSELEVSSNPFAVVVMAHLKALETRRYPKTRLRWKIEIVKGLYARGWSRTNVWELFRFLDWVMQLPERFELQFEKALKEIEEAGKMRYVTHLERRAKAEGIEQGEIKATRESILEVLTVRFQSMPADLVEQIATVSEPNWLKALLRQATVTGSLEEFEHFVETGAPTQ